MIDTVKAQLYMEQAIRRLYQQLQQGLDVSPGERLRLEGKAELLLEWQLLEWHWLKDLVNRLYAEYFNTSVSDDYWLWLENDRRFCLPFKMRDAPVYKG